MSKINHVNPLNKAGMDATQIEELASENAIVLALFMGADVLDEIALANEWLKFIRIEMSPVKARCFQVDGLELYNIDLV